MQSLFTPSILLYSLLTASAWVHAAPNNWVELKQTRFAVEIADTDASRERGLMFRQALEPSAGMLFIHDVQEPVAYWMKNTYIPLDILYFDNQQRLVSAQLRVPPCGTQIACPIYPSTEPTRYVLELNAGTSERLHVNIGDKLTLHTAPASN